MKFRPCIDLHNGKVKQIVGGTLADGAEPQTNFVSDQPPAWFARRYRADGLTGGHVIKLGEGNDAAAREALAAWPGGLQVGGGITAANEHLFTPLREFVTEREWRPANACIDIRKAQLGTWAGAYGAAYHTARASSL